MIDRNIEAINLFLLPKKQTISWYDNRNDDIDSIIGNYTINDK